MIYGWKDQRINVTKLSQSQNESSGRGGERGRKRVWGKDLVFPRFNSSVKVNEQILEYLQ